MYMLSSPHSTPGTLDLQNFMRHLGAVVNTMGSGVQMDLVLFLLGLLPGCLTRGKLLIFSEPSFIIHHTMTGPCSQ